MRKNFKLMQLPFILKRHLKEFNFLKTANLKMVDCLFQHGADLNRLSYINYKWPKEQDAFISFETPLITATRHSKFLNLMCNLELRVETSIYLD